MSEVEKAREFATNAHAKQFRKWTGEPYINHPIEVVSILGWTNLLDVEYALAAAYLHDVIEDCGVTAEDLLAEFSTDVVATVIALTDCEKGNRKERKAQRCEKLSRSSPVVQSIKYADLLSNWPSIRDNDPRFAKVYKIEALALCDAMTQGNALLRRLLIAELDQGGAA